MTRNIRLRTGIVAGAALLTISGWLAAAAPYQAAAPDRTAVAPGESAAAPGEPAGIRFTPEMARAIARKMTPGFKHFELPDDKKDEATEKVARRIMEMAHAIDGKGQELVQRFMEEQLSQELEGERAPTDGFMPRKFGKEFGSRMLDILPPIKDLMRNIVQDIRPMLPMKQQIKMAAETMAATGAIDAFQKTMQKWAKGEVDEYTNPFDRREKPKKDESGQSEDLKKARKSAQEQLDSFAIKEWDRYVQQFKEFYGLNDAQCATVDSMLREFKQRAEQRKRDTAWRDRYYQNRLWLNIFWRVPNGFYHPVQMLVQEDQDEATHWLDLLSAELKSRMETVPTAGQRKAAEERMDTLLKDKGIEVEVAKK